MGKRLVNPLFNVYKKYRQMIFLNPYRFGKSATLDGQFQIALKGSSTAYITNDYGETWQDWVYISGITFTDICFSKDKKYFFATTGNIKAVSSDYGQNFTYVQLTAISNVTISGDGKYRSYISDLGIMVSSDFGETFTLQYTIIKNFKRLVMSESGQYQTVWSQSYNPLVSNDYGITWVPKAVSRTWLYGDMSLSGQYQVGVGYGFSAYVSSDYGQTWAAKDTAFQDYCCAMSGDGKYIIKGQGNLRISTDYGQTWTAKTPSNAIWQKMDISGDGKYMLAKGNTTNDLWKSSDYGQTWQSIANFYAHSVKINRIL